MLRLILFSIFINNPDSATKCALHRFFDHSKLGVVVTGISCSSAKINVESCTQNRLHMETAGAGTTK